VTTWTVVLWKILVAVSVCDVATYTVTGFVTGVSHTPFARSRLWTEQHNDNDDSGGTFLLRMTNSDQSKEGGDDDEEETLVTKEMLQRDLLGDPSVRRKKKGQGKYKTMDNRDALPFVVKVVTPDPYTRKEVKAREALENTKKQNKKKQKKRHNLVGLDQSGIASTLYAEQDDGSMHKVLGEFQLDKNTNCGDRIEVGDQEFEVQRARCQYKYVGGKRFVMVRKILEVKEITRIAEENYIMRQFNKDIEEPPLPPLE